jgi:prepilin-type N-terminal cleavage/methylation domain-containing protein
MSPTSARSTAASGFTLMELMIVMTLLAILSLGVISAYLFMGRNLERLAKTQEQDVAARRLLRQFTQDVGIANGFTSITSSTLTFTVPTAGANTTISYVYDTTQSTLTRTDASGSLSILKNIDTSVTTNGFTYYDESATTLTLPLASAANVKRIGFSFTTKSGNAAVGTQSSYVIVSPRVVVRNKDFLK